jgi:general secretion pathway protein D
VAADFNGDGLPDVAVTNAGANSATVILNSNAIESLLASGLSGGETGTPYPSVEYLDLGVKLKATPRLHPDNEVTLQLSLEIRSLSGETLNDLPIITNRTIEHTVRLKENETSALAGILETQEMHAINGTPGLAGVDTIGLLAGDRTTQDTDDELLVLITPRRINPVNRVSRELYAGHPPQQGGGSVGQTFEERQPQRQPEQPTAAPPEEQPQPPPQSEPEPEPEPEPTKPQ